MVLGVEAILGIIDLSLVLAIGVAAVVAVRRFRQVGGLEEALLALSRHPAQRFRFLVEVSALAAILLVALVLAGLVAVAPGNEPSIDTVQALNLALGAVAILAMTIDGLRSSSLTISDEIALAMEAPELLAATSPREGSEPGQGRRAMYIPPRPPSGEG